MTKEDNIRAILETHFTGFKEEIIDSAVNSLMWVTNSGIGRWKHIGVGLYECSRCYHKPWYSGSIYSIHYCPNCGSRNDEVQE